MKKIRRILFIISICLLIYSVYNIGSTAYQYHQINEQTSSIKKEVVKENKNSDYRTIDFDKLLKRNKDVVGWIYVPGTNIDEVLLKGDDNEYYLHHTIDKTYQFAGQLFVNYHNNSDFTDTNTIVYGHHMRNGSKFASLRKFMDSDFFKKNQTIYIYLTDGTINVYKIYVARTLDASSDLYASDVVYDDYVKQIQNSAQMTRSVSNKEAPLVLLSTCVHATGSDRYVVGGRLEKTIKEES